jgi:hypothetical protein
MNDFFDIPDFEGYYQINKLGEVRSLDRKIPHSYGNKGFRMMKGRIIPHYINNNGYVAVSLSKNGKDKHVKVHIILGKLFISNPDNYPIVRHLNDIKTDISLDNLAWGTQQDNAKDCVRNGTHFTRRGADHPWHGRKTSFNKGRTGEHATWAKIICDLQTGVFYHGSREAAEAKNINVNTLRAKLCGITKNNTFLVYT